MIKPKKPHPKERLFVNKLSENFAAFRGSETEKWSVDEGTPPTSKLSIDINIYYGIYIHMKTSIDFPDALYRRAKICAAEKGESIRDLLIRALDKELSGTKIMEQPAVDDPLFTVNTFGFPVLRDRSEGLVNEEIINQIREDEGI